MATTIGKLAAILSLNSSKFDQGMKGAQKRTSNLRKGLSALKLGVVGAGAAVAGLGTVVGVKLARGLTNSLSEIDELAKISAKLKIPINQLQAFDLAAKFAGVSVEGSRKAIEKMVRSVSEAADGTAEYKDTILELGLNADRLNKMKPDKQFIKIATAMMRVRDQGDRVRIAMALMGRQGANMLNVMQDLDGTFLRAQRNVKDFGLTIDQDTATRVQAFNDNISEVGNRIDGLKRQLAVRSIPYLEAMVKLMDSVNMENLDRWLRLLKSSNDLLAKQVGQRVAQAAGPGGIVQDKVVPAVNAMTRGVNALPDFFKGFKRGLLDPMPLPGGSLNVPVVSGNY